MNIKDTVVIIPVLNEKDSIKDVIDNLPMNRLLAVVVVDNGSTDGTDQVIYQTQAHLVKEPIRGYGMACLSGIKKALTFKPENIAFIDGDFSDYPQELDLLLNKLDQGLDLVIGSRMLGGAGPGSLLPQARWGNWLACKLMHLFYPHFKFSDLGPFRAIKTQNLIELNMQDQNFGWTVEMQLKALSGRLKCQEVSVSYRKRIGHSKITGTVLGTIKASAKILYTLGKFFWNTRKKSPTDLPVAADGK